MPKVTAEMAQMPAASPSRPSMKLTMLMMAAIQMHGDRQEAHSGRSSDPSTNGRESVSIRTEKTSAPPMAASWPKNLTSGLMSM